MDDWIFPYPNPDVDSTSPPPLPRGQSWGTVGARLSAAHADGAGEADAERRAADLQQSRVWDGVDDGRDALDVPLPFATPPGAALTF